MVRKHVWRMLCSVCATGARVAQPVPCNFVILFVLQVSPAPSQLLFQLGRVYTKSTVVVPSPVYLTGVHTVEEAWNKKKSNSIYMYRQYETY